MKFLRMIGHGTDGSDDIEPGIHLRWAFDDKLGFPDCFKLYRRFSVRRDRYEFNFARLRRRMRLPYRQRVRGVTHVAFHFAAADPEGEPLSALEVQTFDHPEDGVVKSIRVDGSVRISFSKPLARVELGFHIEEHTSFDIIAHAEEGDYRPYAILGDATGFHTVAFDLADATGISLSGAGIVLGKLAGWICRQENGSPWHRVNVHCGCGLPIDQERSDYINTHYPRRMPTELAVILCRLGADRLRDSPFAREDYAALRSMLNSMLPEGPMLPVGWTLFSKAEEDGDEAEEGQADVSFSNYDFLLTQSHQVMYAKALGLYFVDSKLVPERLLDEDLLTGHYDYKITAEWPEWNKRRLDHEIAFEDYESGHVFFSVSSLDENTVLLGSGSVRVTAEPFPAARTEQGLQFTGVTSFTGINFLTPVTEVQLFLINLASDPGLEKITIEAYRNYYKAAVDQEELTAAQGVVRLRAKQIDSLKIFGANIVVSRIHYDFEPYPVGPQSHVVCGLSKHAHYPIEKPDGLTASLIPGGTVTDQDGAVSEKPYVVGLRWDANEDPHSRLVSIAPVGYHVQRQREDGTREPLTEGSPLFIAPTELDAEDRNVPEGWPADRQYYLDALAEKEVHEYRIAALDLFGRQSAFTELASYEFRDTPPPHPTDVSAQFLDYGTFRPEDASFADSTLREEDQSWLRRNRRNAIVVRWKWPENLQLQAPDVEAFRVYFKQGWLNTYRGEVAETPRAGTLGKAGLGLTADELETYAILATSPEELAVYTFRASLDLGERIDADALRLCWLKQGYHNFLVLKNTAGARPEITILNIDGAMAHTPEVGAGFSATVTAEKEQFVDYKHHGNWPDSGVSHDEPKDLTPKEDPDTVSHPIYAEEYAVYIADPAFPDPALSATDRDKVRYGQVAVNALAGGAVGSVSPPATVMAVYRAAPAASGAFAPGTDDEGGDEAAALRATAADVHGKSSYALRWPKLGTGVKHQVFRASDESVFLLDNKRRPARDASFYGDFKARHPMFRAADVDAVQDIAHTPDPDQIARNYAGLTPRQLQVLASLPDNAEAFTRIAEASIDEADGAFADRVTEIPHPVDGAAYAPDPDNILLYQDHSLDGRGQNRYFYALKSEDGSGLLSPLSAATLPVEMPKTTPPPAPVINAIAGGDRQIRVKWAANPAADIAGYLLYRTADQRRADDWRRMRLIKADVSDPYTLAADAPAPDGEFSFDDGGVAPQQVFYYGLVAVGLDDLGRPLKSKMSAVKAGQAYDVTPPEPPTITGLDWVKINLAGDTYDPEGEIPDGETTSFGVAVAWDAKPGEQYMVQYANESTPGFTSVSPWFDAAVSDFVHRNGLTYMDQQYRILVRGSNGLLNEDFRDRTLARRTDG